MNTKHEVFSLLVAGSAVCCCAAAIMVIKNPPERQLEVRVLRVTNTVYVPQPATYTPAPMPPPAERTPNLADLYAVPLPGLAIHPVVTNWIYSGKTNFISGLYTNGTAITNSGPYTNNTMRVMTEDLRWTNIYVGKGN